MEEKTRVYPSGTTQRKWLNYLLLFLSAVLLLSGLLWRNDGDGLQVRLAETPTPIPTDAAFDETVESREMTLPTATWYALQLGAFENQEAAKKIAESFQNRGAAGYVWEDTRFRALAALYPTKEEVEAVRAQLFQKHSIEAYAYQIQLPPLVLRMKGMKGQLDILEAAFLHGSDLVSQLQALSMLMDRQEVSVPEAIAQVQAAGQQVETVALRLEQRFSAPRHQAVQGLIDGLRSYGAFVKTVDEKETSVQLATQVKYQAIAALDALKKVYDGLSIPKEEG